MRIVADAAIPYLQGVLEPFAEVSYCDSNAINHATCKDADALLIRTRTRCDAQLLAGTKIRFIGTATIGTDHIDTNYCQTQGICVANAPGCNAWAVVQWVVSLLVSLQRYSAITLYDRPVGIVGCGAIGERLAQQLELFRIPVLRCDPFLERESPMQYTSLSRLARECAIISIHTPLTSSGAHPTYHLLDRAFFRSLRNKPYILHAARGGVVDDYELYSAFLAHDIAGFYLDVYEDEPNVPQAILEAATVATPHIAGYSIEGKWTATTRIVQRIGEFFGWSTPPLVSVSDDEQRPLLMGDSLGDLARSYEPQRDSRMLKNAPQRFENLRREYTLRHDYRHYRFANRALQTLIENF